ncbi:sel1 repeat family protein [Glaciecola sp. MH2013]|uniref:sel1 repeat family protein n=1 Tax=Glaciecola sp. MH2013 TaxID=2785524 RepID=UPI00189E2BE6|nr:sel1 repeat family protein [Glaciecola sp. MH2013]MBF7073440.1 sel1 repeat family protein [Glaciecola sp. MH2013]
MTDASPSSTPLKSRKRTITLSLFWLFVIAGLIAVVNWRDNRNAELIAEQNKIEETPWNPQLLSCNAVVNADPTEKFNECLEMAEEGWFEPMRRLVYAYLQGGEHYNWEEAYYWANRLAKYDYYAEVFSQIILMNFANNPSDYQRGEKGIRRLATLDHPIANAYLASLYYLKLNTIQQQESIRWLLERSYKQDKNWLQPTEFALVQNSGALGKVSVDKTRAMLDDALNIDFPHHANNIAWFLSTTSIPSLFDANKAVDIAESVVADEEHASTYYYVDTLAAAYAAAGDFDSALAKQKEAIDLIQSQESNPDELTVLLADYQSRLDLYKKQERFIDYAFDAQQQDFFKRFKEIIETTLYESFFNELEDKSEPELKPDPELAEPS